MSENYTVGQYVVCFIDLLGVREELFNGIDYHSSNITAQKQQEINHISDTIVNLLLQLASMENAIKNEAPSIFNYLQQISPNPAMNLEDWIKNFQKLKFGCQQFSDTTVLYVKLPEVNEDITKFSTIISAWMTLLSKWQLECMTHGVMVRGAITLGTAWELFPNCLFGPAIHEAYKLESEVAKYPRIVISKHFKEFIDDMLHIARENGFPVDDMPLSCCMFYTDTDGIHALDYLSQTMRNIATYHNDFENFKATVQAAFSEVFHRYTQYKKMSHDQPEKSEIARRYFCMLNYFMNHNQFYDLIPDQEVNHAIQ